MVGVRRCWATKPLPGIGHDPRAWQENGGDHNQAAARLNIHPNSLRSLIRHLHLRDGLE
jgi:hypothetical protein